MTCKKLSEHPIITSLRNTIVRYFVSKTEVRVKEHLNVWGLRDKFSTLLPLIRAVIGTRFILPRFLREVGLIQQDCLECPLEEVPSKAWWSRIHVSSLALFQSAGPILKYLEDINSCTYNTDERPSPFYPRSDPTGSLWSFPPLELPTCTDDPGYSHDETPDRFRNMFHWDHEDEVIGETRDHAQHESIYFGFRTSVEDFLIGSLHDDVSEAYDIGVWSSFIIDFADTESPPRCHARSLHSGKFRSSEILKSFVTKRSGFREGDLISLDDDPTFEMIAPIHFDFYYHNLSLPKRNYRSEHKPPVNYYVGDWLRYFRAKLMTQPKCFTSIESSEKEKEPKHLMDLYEALPKDKEVGVFAFDGERIYCQSERDVWNYVKHLMSRQ